MNQFFKKIRLILIDPEIRNKLLAVVGILALYRLFSSVPLPGVDVNQLAEVIKNNQFFGFLNIFAGGGLSQLSIMMMGVSPYITASIIMQLMTVLSKDLKNMSREEGEIGRKKFQRISRYVTIPIAILQSVGILTLLEKQGVLGSVSPVVFAAHVGLAVAGSFLALWLADRISEYGIGNGTSLIIFAGIVSAAPQQLSQLWASYTPEVLLLYIVLALVAVLIVAGVVFITEAERKVPIMYTRQIRGGNTYGGVSSHIPFRLNMAGVMPIIFAISILLFPQMIVNVLSLIGTDIFTGVATKIQEFLANQLWYGIIYFVLVVIFTYFYTAITVEPHQMAENLHRSGSFIPGIRPGSHTEEFIGTLVSRITLAGALFLGVIAIIPNIVQGLTGFANIGLGGTSILIVVSVVLDLTKKLDAIMSTRVYDNI